MTAPHVVTLDYSPETGSLVVCTCGLVLGPFHEYREARKAAAEHRRWTDAEIIGSADRRRGRDRERKARQAAARRAARERAAEAEGRR